MRGNAYEPRSSGSALGGFAMRIWIAIGMLMATTVGAYANIVVPEIDAFSGMAAMGVVGSIAALIGSAAGANRIIRRQEGLSMRILIAIGMLMATTVAASAATVVPEIDAFSGLAAMGLVGSIAALIWERRRKK